VFATAELAETACTSEGGVFGDAPHFSIVNRGMGFEGRPQRILWVKYGADGHINIIKRTERRPGSASE
jgi:hypothetical protein